MMLNELTAVEAAALPVAEFRDHLRLGTGFADLGAEDAALEAYLRAALAAIEGRTSKVLISRDFLLSLEAWRNDMAQPLPVAPVQAVTAVRLVTRDGDSLPVDPARYGLVQDLSRPRLMAVSGVLPAIPQAGRVDIEFSAGFGPAWSDLPVDLAQAVFLLAAQYYEARHDGAGAGAEMSFGVMALIERWRTVRLLGGIDGCSQSEPQTGAGGARAAARRVGRLYAELGDAGGALGRGHARHRGRARRRIRDAGLGAVSDRGAGGARRFAAPAPPRTAVS